MTLIRFYHHLLSGHAWQPFAHMRAWLDRVEALPGFVAMARSPVTP